MTELKPGLTGTTATIVRETNTAIAMGSGDLQVFATPCMVALMEQAGFCHALHGCPDGTGCLQRRCGLL